MEGVGGMDWDVRCPGSRGCCCGPPRESGTGTSSSPSCRAPRHRWPARRSSGRRGGRGTPRNWRGGCWPAGGPGPAPRRLRGQTRPGRGRQGWRGRARTLGTPLLEPGAASLLPPSPCPAPMGAVRPVPGPPPSSESSKRPLGWWRDHPGLQGGPSISGRDPRSKALSPVQDGIHG